MTWIWLSMTDYEGLTISYLCMQGYDDILEKIPDSYATKVIKIINYIGLF